MNLRKSISLNDDYIKKIEPLIRKHNGNLSAVIREIIDFSDVASKDPDSVKRLILGLKSRQNLTSSTLSWSLKNLKGRLPDDEIVRNIIGTDIISISSLEKHLNEIMGEVYWDSSIKIIFDKDILPEIVSLTISGQNNDMNLFLSAVITKFISKKYELGVMDIRNLNSSVRIEMKKGEKEWVQKSISDNFGYMENAFSELYKKPDFWNMIFSLYAKMNYELVLIPKQLFEEILGGKTLHAVTTTIERAYGFPISQIPLDDLLIKIKEIYQYTGIIENIDIDKNTLIIHHSFSDNEAINRLAYLFTELLQSAGHLYNSTTSRNLIVLKHIPREGKILIKMISELKSSKEPDRDYSKNLLDMLNMLNNIPFNEEIIRSLGSEFGKTLIQNYEEEKKIDLWDAGIFIDFLHEIKIILKQNLKIDIIGTNIIYIKNITCPLAGGDVKSDQNCIFINGIFYGCISYAFGEHTEIAHSVSGNNKCEIFFNIIEQR